MAQCIPSILQLKKNSKLENLAGFATGFELKKNIQKKGGGYVGNETYPPTFSKTKRIDKNSSL